jgi:hypothetical protein
MNKSYTYAVVALALVAVVLVGTSLLVKSPEQAADHKITTVVEGTQSTAAVTQAVNVGTTQNITWDPALYSSANVSIMIIRKVGDNPARYDLVRTISASAPNNGSTVWTPSSNEKGGDIYVQIGCISPTSACRSTISSSPLIVQ